MSRFVNLKNIFWFSILIRIPLLILTPISLFIDGISRYLPDAEKILNGNFEFWSPPLYSLLLSPITFIESENIKFFIFKILNLIIWSVVFRESIRLFRNLDIKEEKIAKIMLLFSCLTWPILLSVSILPDMLFTFLFLLLSNLTIKFQGRNREIIKVIITTLLLLATKPMAIIVLPSIILAFLFKRYYKKSEVENEKLNSNTKATFLKFLIAIFIGSALFAPWLVKNKIINGDFYETVQKEEYSSTLKFIGKDNFAEQAEKAQAYFWEYPSYDNLQEIRQSFDKSFLKNLAVIYYFTNLIAFLITTILIISNVLKKLARIRKNKFKYNQKNFILLSLLLFCFGFSVLYFPFFSKYNYWDTGRYSMPVLVILVYFLLSDKKTDQNWFKNTKYILIFTVIALSIINSYGIVINFRNKEQQLIEIENNIKTKTYQDKLIITNDSFTDEALGYFLEKDIILLTEDEEIICHKEEQIEDYTLCSGSDLIYLKKESSVSRITR